MNNYEDIAKYIETEIDIFEYVPTENLDTFHQYGNYYKTVYSEDAAPRSATRDTTIA